MVQRFCGSTSREKPTHKVLERIKKTIGRCPLAILKQISPLKKSARANVVLPTGRGRMVTPTATMNNEGIVHTKIVNDGTCNGTNFCAFIRELVVHLHEREEMNGVRRSLDNVRI
uniref:Uncharacterized protein n=1 Tax=Plectus sambesii TaxID=2011161 RepID=A0A914WYC9_9BILA